MLIALRTSKRKVIRFIAAAMFKTDNIGPFPTAKTTSAVTKILLHFEFQPADPDSFMVFAFPDKIPGSIVPEQGLREQRHVGPRG